MRDPYGVKRGVIPIDSQDAQVEKRYSISRTPRSFPV